MEKEPCGFVIGADHPLQLKCAHTFLAGRHKLRREHPFRQRDMRPLHDGADGHGKGLAAVLALVDAGACALALQLGYPVASDATARACRAIGPEQRFKMLSRFVVVMVDRIAKINFRGRHGISFENV